MPKIVVPTDFSDNALLAASCAAGIADKLGATLYLLHAMDAATDPILEPVALDTKFLEKYTREEFDRLRAIRNRISDQYPHLSIELRLSKGMAADAILSFSQKEQADLIVMGAHGSRGLKEFFVGSVTTDIIARSDKPVIAVPAEYRHREPRALLLATKKFEEGKDRLSGLVKLAEIFKAPIRVASFVNGGEGNAAEYLDATWHLNHYLEFLQHSFPNIEFTVHRLEGDDLQESIGEYCERQKIDMVAVFSHPRSFLDKLCRPNSTKRVVFHSHIPVLILPGA